MSNSSLDPILQTQQLQGSHYTYTLATREDLPDIVNLHAAIFNLKDPLLLYARYEWKLFRSPTGAASLVLARTNDDTLVGMYGSIPFSISRYGSTIRYQLAIASAVHPEYRNRGIFKSLYTAYKTYSVAHHELPIILGFPNDIAHDIGKKNFGYTIHHYLQTYEISGSCMQFQSPIISVSGDQQWPYRIFRKLLRQLPQPRRFKASSIDSPIKVRAYEEIPEDYEFWWNKCAQQHSFIADRSHELMRWRFFEEPYSKNTMLMFYREHECVGLAVISGKKKITIKDLIQTNAPGIRTLILQALFAYLERTYEFDRIHLPLINPEIELELAKFSPRIINRSAFGIHPLQQEDSKDAYAEFAQLSHAVSGFSFLMG